MTGLTCKDLQLFTDEQKCLSKKILAIMSGLTCKDLTLFTDAQGNVSVGIVIFCSFCEIRTNFFHFVPTSITNIRKLYGKYAGRDDSIFHELNYISLYISSYYAKCVWNISCGVVIFLLILGDSIEKCSFHPKIDQNMRKLKGKYVGLYVSIFDELNLIYALHFVRLWEMCI